MDQAFVYYLRDATLIVCYASAPALVTALLVGFGISFFQAATQIQEQTLTYVPKILAVFLALMFSGMWMMRMIVGYTVRVMTEFDSVIRSELWN